MKIGLVRIDLDATPRIAQMFNKNAADIKKVADGLKKAQSELEGGKKWEGDGAKKFFSEMHDLINPGMKRLGDALEEASKVTKQIDKIWEDADEEASKIIIMPAIVIKGR